MLEHQVAIVTGASSGIGEDVAEALAAAGAAVVINYHAGRDDAEEVVKRIEAKGGRALAIGADVSDEQSVKELCERTARHFGRIDILVANSGIQQDAAIGDMTYEQWRSVLDVNLSGQFLCCREVLRHFRAQPMRSEQSRARGKIICMSSVHEQIPWAGHVNYAASKGGLSMFMKSLALEVAAERVRVNAIAPGAIRTRINRSAWESPEAEAKLLELIPYKRVGEPEDVAKAAVWLASDESDYVTGTTLFVDGGMTLYPAFLNNG